MKKKMKITNYGDKMVGVDIGDVSFIIEKNQLEDLKKKFAGKEDFSIKSLTGKKVSFSVSEHFNAYIISDSHTGDTALVEFDEDEKDKQ